MSNRSRKVFGSMSRSPLLVVAGSESISGARSRFVDVKYFHTLFKLVLRGESVSPRQTFARRRRLEACRATETSTTSGFSSCIYRSIDALKIAKTISTFNLGIFVPFLSKSIHLLSIFIIPSIYLFISITFEYSKYLFITIYYLSRPLSNIPNIYLSYLGILIRIMESRDEKREKKKNVFRVVLRGNDSVGN